jgi:protease I
MNTTQKKGKIGVLIEAHFDETEYKRFNEFFPENGYEVEYISHLWNQPSLTFKGNDFTQEVTVTTEVNQVNPTDYVGIILIGGYAMDRLRYQEQVVPGKPNQAPAVQFLRNAVAAMDTGKIKIGTICHSLWLFCAAPELIRGRKVTCAHNIFCDVIAAGANYVYNGNSGADTHVDGGLITGRHPGVVDQFMQVFLEELEKARVRQAA